MKNVSWRKFLWGASLSRDVDEIKDLIIRYVKEETIKPLKDLGRFVMWGAVGSLFVGFGAVLLLVDRFATSSGSFPFSTGRSRGCRTSSSPCWRSS